MTELNSLGMTTKMKWTLLFWCLFRRKKARYWGEQVKKGMTGGIAFIDAKKI